jgi:1-aminocyclopropane-1-carboxylate deaminase/D-cysteine desulfhydrase-like pyridoxal-dependent ACC family enzyme
VAQVHVVVAAPGAAGTSAVRVAKIDAPADHVAEITLTIDGEVGPYTSGSWAS